MMNLLSGPRRREILLGAGGVLLLALVFGLRSFGAEPEDPYGSLGAVVTTTPKANPGSTPAPLAGRPALDPASLRDPFCSLVGTGEEKARACPVRTPTPGVEVIGLDDIFIEGDVPLARMHVGPIVFPNLHEGEVFASAFTVVSLSDYCGDFQFREQIFTLCEGEEELLR